MASRAYNLTKNRATDRIIVLEKGEGNIKSSGGLTDNRLFSGENKLHAIVDPQTMLWYLKYDHGILPQPFSQRFTSYTKLLEFVTTYYQKRNIKVAKVID